MSLVSLRVASCRLASDRSVLARAFCEYKYLGITNAFGHGSKTEVVNTATNIFYLIFAAVGFYMSRKADPLIKLQCAFLMCTGIGSALYHATGRHCA